MKELKVYQIFLIFILLFVTLCIYMPILNAGYAPTDDWLMLRSYSGALKKLSFDYIVNTFKSFHEGLYHPLVTLSYSLEISLFGFIPAVFHLNNIFLHIINIFLIFLVFFKLSKKNYWVGFFVATLFALHPTRVETVAWISARKDLLYAPFYLLSILFYLKYNERQRNICLHFSEKISMHSHSFSFIHPYIYVSVFFFLLACFSKSMAVTLPFVLVLIDFYTNNFNKKNFKVYWPYFIISLIFIFITFISHYNASIFVANQRLHLTFFKTCINFINMHFNILFYLDKFLLPINLYCMYPFFYEETTSMPPWFIMYSSVVLYLLIYFCFLSLKKTKLFFFGFIFFLITIAPVSGIFPIGDFAVADRYTYLPYLGLFYIFSKLIVFIIKKIVILKDYNLESLFNKKSFSFLFIDFNFQKLQNKILKKSILCYFCISIISCICIFIGIELGYLSYKRVVDWQINHYGPPIKMKYYEFGIKKKTEILSMVYPITNNKYKTSKDTIMKR